MMDENIERAMDAEIEGSNSPQASAELRQQLSRDPAALARFDEYRRLHQALDSVPMVEPPSGLHEAILTAVRSERPAPKARRAGWHEQVVESLRASLLIRPIPAFAMGLLVATVGFFAWSRTDVVRPGAELTGTMAPPATVVDETRLATGGAEVTLESRHVAQGAVLEIETRTTGPADIEIEFNPSGLRPAGVVWKNGDVAHVVLEPGRLILKQQEGTTGYQVPWLGTEATNTVRVTLRTPDGSVQGAIDLNAR